jgi:hypothetical protein
MRPSEDVKRIIKNMPVNTNVQRDDEILNDVLNTFEQSQNAQSASFQPSLWRIIMKSRVSKFAAAIIVIGVVLTFLTSERLNTPAWAIEQTIEALKDLRSIYMVGAFTGGTAEIWMRANEAGTQSIQTVVRAVKVQSHGQKADRLTTMSPARIQSITRMLSPLGWLNGSALICLKC